jgi:HemY protein
VRSLVWFLILAALATGLALAARYNEGYVLLVLPPWRVEASLNLVLALSLLGFVFGYLALRSVLGVLRMPATVRAFRARRTRAKADAALREAVLDWLAGRYGHAIRNAEKAFTAGHAPGLAALVAFRAAGALHDAPRMAQWRDRAALNEAGMRLARLKAEAEVALEQRDFAAGRDCVRTLIEEGGQHIAALRLSLAIHQGLGDWAEVLRLTRTLEKHKALTAEQAAPLRLRAHREAIAALAGDPARLSAYWKGMPEVDRREVRLAQAVAGALAAADNCGESARLVEDFLDGQWDSSLVEAYGTCQGGDVLARIAHAEKWLHEHPRDAQLLLTLGRLCRQKQLWGKAQSYLEASLAIAPTIDAHLELAGLLEGELEQPDAAQHHYRRAALLTQSQSRGGRKSV